MANGTISLDKAWYSDSSVVTVTVQDSDLDTSTAADTAVTFDNDGGAQVFTLTPNLADTNGDGNFNPMTSTSGTPPQTHLPMAK